jgi:hypothetical protein
VTGFTLLRGAFEAGSVVGSGLVAFTTGDGTMRAKQWEIRVGVIEAVDVHPGLCAVAGCAAKGGPIGAFASHAIGKFTFVRIVVTSRAGAVLKMKRNNFVGAPGGARFVAIDAGDSEVSSGERETRFAVFGDCEGGAVETLHRVAIFAAVVIGGGGELIVVGIFVALEAGGGFYFINGIFACRNMAQSAFYFGVHSLERILRGVVFFDPE